MFFSQHFSFPCQYHSTNAPYSFIHLPLTLYNVFRPALHFPLSISFNQCSILIHSPTTHAVLCFSPNTSVSPVSIIPPTLHTHSFICHRRCIMFSPSTSVSPVSIIPPMLHTHSSIYHPRCIMFFSQHFSFPCQYHSTNAPYSFIHLPPTLYNVFLPALQFPLSVSFQHCSNSCIHHRRCKTLATDSVVE